MATNRQWLATTIPIGGTISAPDFVAPENAVTMAIHIPVLEAATTVALQSNRPKEQQNEADVWTTITVFDLTDGTFEALDGMGGTSAALVTVPLSATGPGPFRFLASGAQSSAAREIRVAFGET
jgi:hypothetical protein